MLRTLSCVDTVVARLATATAFTIGLTRALGPAAVVSRNGMCKVAGPPLVEPSVSHLPALPPPPFFSLGLTSALGPAAGVS